MRPTPPELASAGALVRLRTPTRPPFRPWEDAAHQTARISHARSTLPLKLQLKDQTPAALLHPSRRLHTAQLPTAVVGRPSRGPTLAPIVNSAGLTSLPPLASLPINQLGGHAVPPLPGPRSSHILPLPTHAVAGRSPQRSGYRPTAGRLPLRPLRPHPSPKSHRLPSLLNRAPSQTSPSTTRGPKWATSSSPSLKTSPLRGAAHSSPLRAVSGDVRELAEHVITEASDEGTTPADGGGEVDELDDVAVIGAPIGKQTGGQTENHIDVEVAGTEAPPTEALDASAAGGRKRKAKRDSTLMQERRALPPRKVRKIRHEPTPQLTPSQAAEAAEAAKDHDGEQVVGAEPKPRAVADGARKGNNIERKLANFRAGKVYCYRRENPMYDAARNMDVDLRDKVFEWGTAADGPLLEQALWPYLSDRQKRVVMTRNTPEGRDMLKALRLLWLIEFTDCVDLQADVELHCHRSIDNGMPCAIRLGMKGRMCAGCHLSKMTCDNKMRRDPQTIRRPAITDLRLYYHRLFNLRGLVDKQPPIDYDAELPPVPAGNPIDTFVRRARAHKAADTANETAAPPAEAPAAASHTAPNGTGSKKRVAADADLDAVGQVNAIGGPPSAPPGSGRRVAKPKRSLVAKAKAKVKGIVAVLTRPIDGREAHTTQLPPAKRRRLGALPVEDTDHTENAEGSRESTAGPSRHCSPSHGAVARVASQSVAPPPPPPMLRQPHRPDHTHAIHILREGKQDSPAYAAVWQLVQERVRTFASDIDLPVPPAQTGESAEDLLRRVQSLAARKPYLGYLLADHSNARINIVLAVSALLSNEPYPPWLVGPLMRRLVSPPVTGLTDCVAGIHWSCYHAQMDNGDMVGILGYVPADSSKASHWAAFIIPFFGPQAGRPMIYPTPVGPDVFSHGIFSQWLHQLALPRTAYRHKRLASDVVLIECRVEDEAAAALAAFEQLAARGSEYHPRIPDPEDFASRVRLPQARVLAHDQVIAKGVGEALRSKDGLAAVLVEMAMPH